MTISPDLPLGMSFNFNTLRFQGTPYKVITPTIYTIAAKNGAGTSTVSLKITVTSTDTATIPPNISYAKTNYSFIIGEYNEAIMSNTGGRFSYMVVFPSLPKGIMLDTTTGKISGTPTEILRIQKNILSQ